MNTKLGFVIVAGSSACGLANAQGLSPIYIRGGGLWPISSSTRSDATNYGFTVGLGYILEGKGLGSMGGRQGSVAFDFSHIGGSTDIETYDLEYVERFTVADKIYLGIGGGMRVAHFGTGAPSAAGGSGGSGGSGGTFHRNDSSLFGNSTNNQTTFVGEILAGFQLTKNFAIEVSGKFAPVYHTENTNSITLMANFRF